MTHRIDKEYFALDHLTVYMIKTNRVREDSNNFGIKKEISIRERDKTKKEEKKMPPRRIELRTSSLQDWRSTTEL